MAIHPATVAKVNHALKPTGGAGLQRGRPTAPAHSVAGARGPANPIPQQHAPVTGGWRGHVNPNAPWIQQIDQNPYVQQNQMPQNYAGGNVNAPTGGAAIEPPGGSLAWERNKAALAAAIAANQKPTTTTSTNQNYPTLFLTPAEQATLDAAERKYGINHPALLRMIADKLSSGHLQLSQAQYAHDVSANEANQQLAGRGVFQSGIRDSDLVDIDRTLGQRQDLINSTVNSAINDLGTKDALGFSDLQESRTGALGEMLTNAQNQTPALASTTTVTHPPAGPLLPLGTHQPAAPNALQSAVSQAGQVIRPQTAAGVTAAANAQAGAKMRRPPAGPKSPGRPASSSLQGSVRGMAVKQAQAAQR